MYVWGLRVGLTAFALRTAYTIRLYAVTNFGRVIHEFDPWFNYRATEYLSEHGHEAFFKWFDHMSWYPLGRPVGSTIYPGMQFVSVWIYDALRWAGYPMSLNDVCVFVPAWGGVVATFFLGLLAWECYGDVDAGVAAAVIMSMIPAHIMRSVAGGFDNESVAVPAMCATFFFWCRSLRCSTSWYWGVITGLSYFLMVASWGGYIFVVNLIALHAAAIAALNWSTNAYLAYSLFYTIGTSLAIQVPVVGYTPLRSLEQMGPLVVFIVLQIMMFCEIARKIFKMSDKTFDNFRRNVFLVFGTLGIVATGLLLQMGYFGPLSSRVRGLFVRHTRTGNPLVDSVAEHQATSPMAYWHYLYTMCYLGPVGFVISCVSWNDSRSFVPLYAAVAYYFSSKMNRLILLMGPISAVLGGIAVSGGIKWAIEQISIEETITPTEQRAPPPTSPPDSGSKKGKGSEAAKKEAAKKEALKGASKAKAAPAPVPAPPKPRERWPPGITGEIFGDMLEPFVEAYEESLPGRKTAASVFLVGMCYYANAFYYFSERTAEAMSQPSIMFKTKLKSGEAVIVDDFREAYTWLRVNTPEDARVMAWWDYGYQIAGVANRTTIADGNTWNHEHIATLGKCLTSEESEAHTIIRHLADYVLLWTGGGGDDLAKSPHMARIANSVFKDTCPGDPACTRFGVNRSTGEPTEMMAASVLWKMHGHNQKDDVQVNPELFEEAYTSTYNLVRIFKVLNISEESRSFAADPQNWKCDAPGSWYCEGQYPPALLPLIEQRKAFKQLEDFNAGKGDKEAIEYQKAYHERLSKKKGR